MYALPMAQTPTTYSATEAEMSTHTDTCTWCEDEQAVVKGYDEHNGPWSLCGTCKADAEAEGQVFA